jgi:adenine-specific DNA-methyltransferase
MVDTKFFEENFKYELLATFDDLEEELGGLLVNGENYQGLSLLQTKYNQKINAIYIDPPYNTELDRTKGKFLYKDSFANSSWLSFVKDRIQKSKDILNNDGFFFSSIDENELFNYTFLLNSIFNEKNFIENFSWVKTETPSNLSQKSKKTIEYLLAYQKNTNNIRFKGRKRSSSSDNPLLKPNNKKKELVFPANTVKTNLKDSGSFEAGEYGTETNKIVLKNKIEYRDGIFTSQIEMDGNFVWVQDKLNDEIKNHSEIRIKTETLIPSYEKTEYNAEVPSNLIDRTDDVGTNENASSYLFNLFGYEPIEYPKPVSLIDYIIGFCTNEGDTVLDYFAGSGTTGEAVIKNMRQNYVLIEMGSQCKGVIIPRIAKICFSETWNNGVPQDKDGQSHAFKYHFIESYEDALNNIEFKNKEDAQGALDFDDYMLQYMLDFATGGVSPSLLKEEAFEMPFDYQLKIQRGHESPAPEKVDLVETFHYLIGLWVKKLRRVKHQDRNYIVSTGEIRSEDAIEDILVVWRNTKDLDLDKEAEWLQEDIIEDQTFDRMYINGNSKIKDAEPTEITFREKMFE